MGDKIASKAATRPEPADDVFLAASQRGPLLALLQGLERGEPFMVITGEAGVGKTTLLQNILPAGESDGTQRIWHATQDGRQVTRVRVLSEIAAQGRPGDAPGSLLEGQSGRCGRTVLVIDDAHLLTPEAIGTLLGILDLAAAGLMRFQLVLVGRPMLWNRLRRANAVDRVKVSGEVAGLPPGDAREYLRERLEPSGTPIDDSLTEDARAALRGSARWTPAELDATLASAGRVGAGQGAGRTAREIVGLAALSPGTVTGAGPLPEAEPPVSAAQPSSPTTARQSAPPRALRRVGLAAAALVLATAMVAGALYWSRVPTGAEQMLAERTFPKPAVVARPDASPANVPAGPPNADLANGGRLAPTIPAVPPPAFTAQQPSSPRLSTPSPTDQRSRNVTPELAATVTTSGTAQGAAGALPKAAVRSASEQAPRMTVPPASLQPQSSDNADSAKRRLAVTMPAAQLDELLRRGEAMLARGNVIAARALYERAALANSGAAATILGKTYDPIFLAGIGAVAIKPAPSSAAAWYKRAAELGDKEAQDRLLQLRSRASQIAGND